MTTVKGQPGAVEANALVRVTNVDASSRTSATVQINGQAGADGAFQLSLQAQVGDRLEVVAIDASGNASAATTIQSGPAPASLELRPVAEDEQVGVAGRTLTDPLQVKVTAPAVGEVPGVAIVFEIVSGGGQLSDTRAVTDADGLAAVEFTLGPELGAHAVAARLEILPQKEIVFTAEAVGEPRIDAVDPGAGMPGDVVEVTGANFSPIARHNVVRFGGEKGTVFESTPTSLSVEVAAFATAGPVTVELTGVASNAVAFDVAPAPVEAPPVGDVELVTLAGGKGRVFLPFESAAHEYIVIVQAMKPQASTFTTRVVGAGVTIEPRGGLAGAGGPSPIAGESLIRALERRVVPELPPPVYAERRLAVAQTIGSKREFFVVNDAGPINIRDESKFDRVTATLKFVGDNSLIWVDDRTPPENLPDLRVEQIGRQFDASVYPRDVGAFGATSDIDGDGKVNVLLSPTVNSLTTPAISLAGARIVGFFFGIDLLPHPTQNPFSNETEVFYAVIPDPDRRFGSAVVTVEEIVELLLGVFAHELEHMISFNHHVLVHDGAFEALWLDEGLAHMAEAINHFHFQNELRSAFFLDSPGLTSLVTGGDALDERGAAYLFVQYMADRFGEEVLGRLVQTSLTSTTNVSTATDVAFQFLFHEWAAALFLDDTGLAIDPRFEIPSLDVRDTFEESKELLNRNQNPPRIPNDFLDVTTTRLPGGATVVEQVGTSPVYLKVTARARANAPIEIEGEAGSELQVTIIRTR